MEEYQLRVVAESEALAEKVDSLSMFCDSDDFEGLQPVEQGLLHFQLGIMEQYEKLLLIRIDLFNSS